MTAYLVVLSSLTKELLLDVVDTYSHVSHTTKGTLRAVKLTLVKVVLVLLRLAATASSGVQLISNAAEETAGLLLARRALGSLLIGLLVVVVAAGKLVDEVHLVCRLRLKAESVGSGR
jgi:hypothetical protein